MARTCGSPMRPGFWCVRSRRPSTVIWASQVHRTAGPFSGKVPGAGHRRVIGAPGEIRTPDPQIRSLMLYPAELRAPEALSIGSLSSGQPEKPPRVDGPEHWRTDDPQTTASSAGEPKP